MCKALRHIYNSTSRDMNHRFFLFLFDCPCYILYDFSPLRREIHHSTRQSQEGISEIRGIVCNNSFRYSVPFSNAISLRFISASSRFTRDSKSHWDIVYKAASEPLTDVCVLPKIKNSQCRD